MGDVSGTPGQVSGAGSVIPSGDTTVTPAKSKTGYSTKDTISTSDIDPSLLVALFASFPVLPAPTTDSSNSTQSGALSPAQQFELGVQQTCISMLTAWNDQLAEIAKRNREQENDPNYQLQQQKLRQGTDNLVSNNDTANVSFVNSAVIAGGILASVGVVDTVSTNMVSVTPQIDAINAVWQQATTAIPSDMRAELGLIGAMAMGSLIAYNTLDSIGVVQGGSKPVDPKTAASNFAEKVLGYVNSDNVDNLIGAFFANKIEGTEQLSPEQKAQLTSLLKSVLIATALAGLYKASTGYQSGVSMQQFLNAILNGTAKPQNDQEAKLFAAFQNEMANLTPAQQTSIVQGISSLMQNNPDMEAILDPGKGFESIAAYQPPTSARKV